MIGLVVGIAESYAFYKFKQDVHSEVKIRTQENIIKQQDNDIKLVEKVNSKLYDKIDKLEAELKELKK
jgi:hypothetical protein